MRRAAQGGTGEATTATYSVIDAHGHGEAVVGYNHGPNRETDESNLLELDVVQNEQSTESSQC
jgi:hypothetical protein